MSTISSRIKTIHNNILSGHLLRIPQGQFHLVFTRTLRFGCYCFQLRKKDGDSRIEIVWKLGSADTGRM